MFTGVLDPVSNAATWEETFEVFDDEDGSPVDISAATEITLIVRSVMTRDVSLTLTLTGGEITIVDTGVFQWRTEATNMGGLIATRSYEVVCRIEMDGDTTQLIIGTLPVLEG